jgi:polysaccharide export outer membrane protein
MKKFLVWGIALLICMACRPISAADAADSSADDYIIGPRDVLDISVWGESSLESLAEVSATGTVNFFFLGDVQVSGLTLKQAREKITALLEDGYIKNPIVIIKVSQFKSKEVQIQGAVSRPGTFVLETNTTTLLKLISMAGGATSDRGSLALIYRGGSTKVNQEKPKKPVAHPVSDNQTPEGEAGGPEHMREPPESLKGEESIKVDLRQLLELGKPENDVVILPGDFVLIPSKGSQNPVMNFVYVDGAVKTPQQVEYVEGLTALQAIIKAGGFSDVASPNQTWITRIGPDGKTVSFRVKLKNVQKGKIPDPPLQPGDRVNVREGIF